MLIRMAVLAALTLALGSCTDKPSTMRSETVKPTALDLSGLPPGDGVKVAWVEFGTLHSDQADVEMPQRLSQVAVTKDHLVVKEADTNHLFVHDRAGGNAVKWPAGEGRLAINAKRNVVAWLTPTGVPMFQQDGDDEAHDLASAPGDRGGDAIAVDGTDCLNGPETVEGAGCTIAFTLSDSTGSTPFLASNHGFTVQADDRIRGLQDVGPNGRLAGWTKIEDDATTCSLVTDGNKNWDTCTFLPLSFSPDGAHLLATGPHGWDGLGTGQLSVLDAKTGQEVLTLRTDEKSQAFITDMQWEDNDSVLAVVFQQGKWAIMRVSLDGSADLPAAAVPGEETDAPYRLAVQP